MTSHHDTTTTALICSECGRGNYCFAIPGYVECTAGCGHVVNVHADITLDEGEELTTVDGLLSVVTPA